MDQQPSQLGNAKSKQGQEYHGVSFHSDVLFLTKLDLQIWGEQGTGLEEGSLFSSAF